MNQQINSSTYQLVLTYESTYQQKSTYQQNQQINLSISF